jgi:HTH-type transcriptional regulator, sugar sensing transcriptional regulator
MKDTVRLLQRLGFGDYEAKAYIGLLQGGPMSGYELAKVSGVPRANVYDVLPKLEERGAVVRLDSPSGARYSAVPTSQLMPRLADRFNDDLAAAEEALVGQAEAINQDYAWNVESYRSVIDHARTLADGAEKEMLLAVWPQEAELLSENLLDAEERGVSVTTLCLAACAQECGNCRGSIYRYRLSPDEASRWLVVGIDGKEMLAGEIDKHESAYAIRTTHKLLVELAGWYVRNSIALATLVSDLGDRLPGMLSRHGSQVLASLSRGGLAGGWLEQLRAVLGRPPTRPPGKEAAALPQAAVGREEPINRVDQ